MSRPLCPHCFRESCTWLNAWLAVYRDHRPNPFPTQDACPYASTPLAPNARKRVVEALERRPRPFVVDGELMSPGDVARKLNELHRLIVDRPSPKEAKRDPL